MPAVGVRPQTDALTAFDDESNFVFRNIDVEDR